MNPITGLTGTSKLAEQNRDELLTTVRRLLAETEALSSRIAAVNEIGIAINRTPNVEEILKVVARQAKWLLDFDHLSVCLRGEFVQWSYISLFGPELTGEKPEWFKDTLIGTVIKTGQSRLVREPGTVNHFPDYPSIIILPLMAGGEVLGTINFFSRMAASYTQEDQRVGYLLALQLSSAIRNAENFRDMKRVEDELLRYNAELEARNRELDAFSHTIAHDLKTPLSAILLKTYMVKKVMEGGLPDKALRSLGEIDNSVRNMTQMIDQLLWLAKMRDTTGTSVTVNVNGAVERAVSRFEEAIESQNVTVEVARDLPNAFGHEQWVEEVFANLIGNAIKYMGKDNPNRHIFITGCVQGEKVRYLVRDTGVGIAPADQTRLFDMFTRLHTVKAEGLGLGLSIVKRIVTRLKGTIGVESTLGEGSTFWFTLSIPPNAPQTSQLP